MENIHNDVRVQRFLKKSVLMINKSSHGVTVFIKSRETLSQNNSDTIYLKKILLQFPKNPYPGAQSHTTSVPPLTQGWGTPADFSQNETPHPKNLVVAQTSCKKRHYHIQRKSLKAAIQDKKYLTRCV